MPRATLRPLMLVVVGVATMLCPQMYAREWWPGNFAAYMAAFALGWLLFVALVVVMPPEQDTKPIPRSTHLPPGHQPHPDDLTINWGTVTSRLPVDEAERIALDLLGQVRAARARAAAPTQDQK
ncbi:hypothetical protein ABZ897_16035 [Nonomuraea sp. NPDC046802]|uniref:hypothetical protein n=1 Tax=Nonomuraea sp. NPDC046802 TaxID=3154919 RepID=UPI00340B793B